MCKGSEVYKCGIRDKHEGCIEYIQRMIMSV